MALLRRSTFSPAQPWARQDAPFSPGGDGETHVRRSAPIILPSLLVFSFLRKVDGSPLRFAMDAGALSRRSPLGDGETQCSKVRSDNVSDGLSLRSQAAIGPCSLSIA